MSFFCYFLAGFSTKEKTTRNKKFVKLSDPSLVLGLEEVRYCIAGDWERFIMWNRTHNEADFIIAIVGTIYGLFMIVCILLKKSR